MQEPEDQEGREEREGAEMTTKLRLENDQEKACWIAVIAGFTANSSDICWDSAFQWADRIVSAFRERCGEGDTADGLVYAAGRAAVGDQYTTNQEIGK